MPITMALELGQTNITSYRDTSAHTAEPFVKRGFQESEEDGMEVWQRVSFQT